MKSTGFLVDRPLFEEGEWLKTGRESSGTRTFQANTDSYVNRPTR